MTTALFADLSTRTVRGLLLPYNELSRRSVTTEPVMFEKGGVSLPRDPDVVTLNEGHSQFSPVGRAVELTDTDKGVEAAFRVANTPEGDDLLLRASDPDPAKRPRLSAEVAGLIRTGQKAVARLTGAAVVPVGAFASAGLFELAPGEEEQVEDAVVEAVAETAPEVPADTVDQIVTAVVERLNQPSADPGEETNPEGAFAMTNATVPAGVVAPVKQETSAAGLFAAIAHKDSDSLKKYSSGDLFAIENIQHSGPSSVTIGADVQQPGYLGELWTRRTYQRKYAPLFTSRPLTSFTATGWVWDPANSPEVAAYAGNAAEIPSNALDTIQKSVTATRVAGGNKIDRRFLDFPDQGVIASYFDKMTEHYARFVDTAVLAAAVTAAGSDQTIGGGTTYPFGQAVGIAAIVDGALHVIGTENTPSFAVVSPELWRDIVLIGQKDVLGYLSAGLGLEEGDLAGFKLIPGSVGTGKVLVGAKEAMTVFELPGSPIRVEGIDPHHGAIDPALFGYYATLVNNADALTIVDTTDYTAPVNLVTVEEAA